MFISLLKLIYHKYDFRIEYKVREKHSCTLPRIIHSRELSDPRIIRILLYFQIEPHKMNTRKAQLQFIETYLCTHLRSTFIDFSRKYFKKIFHSISRSSYSHSLPFFQKYFFYRIVCHLVALWKPVHIMFIFCLWTCTSQKFTTTVSSFLNLKNVCRTRRSYVTQNSVCILHRQKERVILFRFRSQIFVFKRYQLSNPEFWIILNWLDLVEM